MKCLSDNLGGLCNNPRTCPGPPPGIWYDVYRDGIDIGNVCLTNRDAEDLGVLTIELVIEAFERLGWPASELSIEPPDGETLVNFDTNFFTTNTQPTQQTVTLVSQQVTIEATPVEYLWVFGDGDSLATQTPGAAYPDLEVTHRYTVADAFAPRVDTTYAGRYRVGGGPWQDIPQTRVIAGASVSLAVLEAAPRLVG